MNATTGKLREISTVLLANYYQIDLSKGKNGPKLPHIGERKTMYRIIYYISEDI